MGMQDAYADMSDQFNTPLTAEEEAQFQRWRSGLPRDLQNMGDYDLRGAWKNDARAAANGHLPDTWKKPNHATFSGESQYSNAANQGGEWDAAGKGKWAYWATPANLKYRSATDLDNYFKQSEPDSALILPFTYKMPVKSVQ